MSYYDAPNVSTRWVYLEKSTVNAISIDVFVCMEVKMRNSYKFRAIYHISHIDGVFSLFQRNQWYILSQIVLAFSVLIYVAVV